MLASRPVESEALPATFSRYAADKRARQEILRAALAALSPPEAATDSWVVDLGCGHGHFLTAYARQHPGERCLGVDFCRDRIRRAERKRQFAGLGNLHFIHGEIGEFLAAVPDGMRLHRVFVLFPDPWPKRRHRKNRLLSTDFLTRIARLGGAACELFFRSDAVDYVAEVRALLGKHERWRLMSDDELPFEAETVFQKRAAHFGSIRARLN